jgi:hypothetical protein
MKGFLICTLHRYNSGYKIKENEMDGALTPRREE